MGYLEPPKIEALHRLIDWLNNSGKFPPIQPLGLDKSSLKDNGGLTGLLEADSNFNISYLLNQKGIAIDVDITMRLSQQQNSQRDSAFGTTYESIMSIIATF